MAGELLSILSLKDSVADLVLSCDALVILSLVRTSFGLASRCWQLAIQKRNIFDSQLGPAPTAMIWTISLTCSTFKPPFYTQYYTRNLVGRSLCRRYTAPTIDLGGHALAMGSFGALGYAYYKTDQHVLGLLEVRLHRHGS